jgi:predicted metal-dependent hydrolase
VITESPHDIRVGGLSVTVARKVIKNLHLGVYPPDGRVRVAAPITVSDEAVRLAVIGKLGWIRRQQARFASQARQSPRELVSGETHFFQGERYRLRVIEEAGPGRVVRTRSCIELHVRAGTGFEGRQRVLLRWYRDELRRMIPSVVSKWEAAVGVPTADWRIKRMKTRWGACNTEARRIWLNLELVKKPPRCLEYVVLHEILHLVERRHGPRFLALLDRHMPQWRSCRQELNAEPLAHETWAL